MRTPRPPEQVPVSLQRELALARRALMARVPGLWEPHPTAPAGRRPIQVGAGEHKEERPRALARQAAQDLLKTPYRVRNLKVSNG
jgi:hypothetical protein